MGSINTERYVSLERAEDRALAEYWRGYWIGREDSDKKWRARLSAGPELSGLAVDKDWKPWAA